MSFRRSRRSPDLYRRVRRALREIGPDSDRVWSHPFVRAARQAVGRALAALILCSIHIASAAAQDVPAALLGPEPEETIALALYGGRLMTVQTDGATAAKDLFAIRFIAALPLDFGFKLAVRGDMTALGPIDPTNVDIESARSLEGYLALSRSWRLKTLDVGPAVMAGALVPVDAGVTWASRNTYGAGVRLGRGRSWVYALYGKNGAADATCGHSCDAGDRRFVFAGSIEFGRVAAFGDYVSGFGGYGRAGFFIRVPLPGGE